MTDLLIQSSQCFVCDKDLSQSKDRNALLLSNLTEYSRTGLPTKIGQLMGDGFMVVVTACDEACNRCYDLLNLLDKLEVDIDKVRRLLTSYLRKKYGLLESKYLFCCMWNCIESFFVSLNRSCINNLFYSKDIKEEPSESYDDRAPLFDERAKRNLEEEVNQVLVLS